MPALTNPKHESFCQALAKGKSMSQAYADAGYQACRQSASRLSAKADIKARCAEIKERQTATVDPDGRDPETGQFKLGHKSLGGRPRGARSKLSEMFLDDLSHAWERSGSKALDRVIEQEPVQFVKIIASLQPAKIAQTLDVTIGLYADCANYHEAWRLARSTIGADDDPLLIEGEASAE